MMVMTP
jgi:hypothetical protein